MFTQSIFSALKLLMAMCMLLTVASLAYARGNPPQVVNKTISKDLHLALTQQEKHWLDTAPQPNVAVKTGWMPIEFKLENEKHRGIAIDYLEKVSDLSGLRFKMLDFNDRTNAHNVSVISSIGGTAPLPDGYHRLPVPYLSIPYAIYIHRDHRPQWHNAPKLSDLDNYRVAIFKNASLAKKISAENPHIRLVQVEIADDAFELLRNGQIDTYIGNEVVVDYHIEYHRLGFAMKLGVLPVKAEVYMAVADTQPQLSSILQKSIDAIGVNREDMIEPWRPMADKNDRLMKILIGIFMSILMLAIYRMVKQHRKFQRREQRSQKKIWQQANFDYLTDLPNRYFLQAALKQAIMRAQHHHQQAALLLLDLDGFKDVNDIAGHVVGDKLLTMVAQRLKESTQESQITARLGGDEFVVLVPEYQDIQLLNALAQDILQVISHPYRIDGKQFYVTASIGIATYPGGSKNADELLIHADQALFAAKHAGKNQYQLFTQSMLEAVNDRLLLINDLRVALQNNQFYMNYQPIFDLRNGGLIKAEALLRWKHPTRGDVRPDIFVKLAEESGFMTELGRRVLDLVLEDLPLIHRTFGSHFMVGINISPSQFLHPEYLLSFVEALKHRQIPCQSICFEITEGLFLEPSTIVQETLHYLHQTGIKLSIDDFGTGYSALAYLKNYPIDYVKIDKSFVRTLSENRYDFILCKSIIQMSHQLDIQVVAEGVEELTQKEILQTLDCDYIQGFLIGRPIALPILIGQQDHASVVLLN